MSPAEILALIQIATQLAKIINESVKASDSQEVKAAWAEASTSFAIGYGEDYGNSSTS